MTVTNFQDRPIKPRGRDASDVSVVIVSWNVRELLKQCIQAVLEQAQNGNPSIEVIVVDSASSDGSADVASQLGVRVIPLAENIGYGRASNFGFREARGRYILVLNADTIPLAWSVAALYNFAEQNPQVGIVAPRLLNQDGSVQRSAFRFPTLAMALLDLFPPPTFLPGRVRAALGESRINGRYPDEPQQAKPFRCDHPLGAAMLIRRDALLRLGGFDPSIFMYSEEIDLAMRFMQGGYSCWQVPAARVVHLGGQSTAQVPGRMFVELWRSRLYLYSKHYSLPSQVALRAILAAAMITRIAAGKFRAAFASKKVADAGIEGHVIRMALGRNNG